MRRTIRLSQYITTATLTLCCTLALAHSDDGGTLFVAGDGTDAGRCDNALEPCRSIAYALRMAGKGAEVRVTAGAFPVDNADDLFHIVSGVINVKGGYSRADEFRVAGSDPSILTGVPHDYREALRERGFDIIADRKAISTGTMDAAGRMLERREQLRASLPAATCDGGRAAGLPCNQVDLLSHLAFADISAAPSAANDVWGFVDLNSNREYAVVGYNFGTAVVDVTNPELPREVGFIHGQAASWRDIKIYQFFDDTASRWRAYAYVSTDGSTDGIFVIDLSALPHAISRVGFASDIQRAHNVYISNIDFSTGIAQTERAPLLIAAGSEFGNGKFRLYSLADPAAPSFVGAPSTSDYMHDAASIVISDSRKDTQCLSSGPYCEVLLDFNETTVDIWDITDSSALSRLSSSGYDSPRYVHSGWWSEDKQFVFVQDELDESQRSLPTTLRIFSIADLQNPSLVGTWSGPTGAIDHNGFVRGNRYYMSNYSRGLSVLDITTPATPVQLGYIDTSPSPENAVFAGAWGAYPFFPSGSIAISDMQSGLYLVSDGTRDVAAGSLQFAVSSEAVAEGQRAQLRVQRSGASTGAVTVNYEILAATADAADYLPLTGTLAWANGDSGERIIGIDAVSDGVAENLEQFIVRLVDPGGGATLGNRNTASVYIGDPGAAAEISFAADSLSIAERGFATAVIVLQRRQAAAAAASVDYSLGGGDAAAGADFTGNASGTIAWPAGDGSPKTLEFAIADDGVGESSEFFELVLSNPVGATISGAASVRVTIEDGSGLNRAPNAIAGASQTVRSGTRVSLNGGQSTDSDGDRLSFSWQQIAGPGVGLSAANSALSQFTAPAVSSDTLLQFRLTVTDPAGLSDSSTVTVTVLQQLSSNSSSGGASGPFFLLLLLGLRFAIRRTT